jgi:hypothetical protein
MNLHTHSEAFGQAIVGAAQHLGLSETLVEKDYWVTLVLKAIFSQEQLEHEVVFNGKTPTAASRCAPDGRTQRRAGTPLSSAFEARRGERGRRETSIFFCSAFSLTSACKESGSPPSSVFEARRGERGRRETSIFFCSAFSLTSACK